MIGHFGKPSIGWIVGKDTTLGLILTGIYNNSFLGPAAVIVFFVISGLCIHYPHVHENKIPSKASYFTRRYVRISIPMLIALLLASTLIPTRLNLLDKTVLWSLLAELIYYTLYPAFLWLRRSSVSWVRMILVTMVSAFVIAASKPLAGDYPSFGPQLNWLLGLPCWLVGCKLAEFIAQYPNKRDFDWRFGFTSLILDSSIWLWRIFIFGLAMVFSAARFHSPLGYPWTLKIFAMVAAVWLMREIYRYKEVKPVAILEWAGSWSYSLYFVHPLALTFLAFPFVPKYDGFGAWIVFLSIILLLAYIFALLVEFPSHSIARKASVWMRSIAAGPMPSKEQSPLIKN